MSLETIAIILTVIGMVGAAIWMNARTIASQSDTLTNKLDTIRRENEDGRGKLYAEIKATATEIRDNYIHKDVLAPELAVRDMRITCLDYRMTSFENTCDRRHSPGAE